jgi:hypothetical protein
MNGSRTFVYGLCMLNKREEDAMTDYVEQEKGGRR